MNWKSIAIDGLPTVGKMMKTKIDDHQGVRNETKLYFSDTPAQLWFDDSGNYMYYRPTHWRELTPDEKQMSLSALTDKHSAERDNFMKRYVK